jgi:hypothetical protein
LAKRFAAWINPPGKADLINPMIINQHCVGPPTKSRPKPWEILNGELPRKSVEGFLGPGAVVQPKIAKHWFAETSLVVIHD